MNYNLRIRWNRKSGGAVVWGFALQARSSWVRFSKLSFT